MEAPLLPTSPLEPSIVAGPAGWPLVSSRPTAARDKPHNAVGAYAQSQEPLSPPSEVLEACTNPGVSAEEIAVTDLKCDLACLKCSASSTAQRSLSYHMRSLNVSNEETSASTSVGDASGK